MRAVNPPDGGKLDEPGSRGPEGQDSARKPGPAPRPTLRGLLAARYPDYHAIWKLAWKNLRRLLRRKNPRP